MKISPDVKDTASFVADLADVLFKLLAIMLVVPSMALWIYLNRLGWGSLFLEAVLSVNGLWGLLLWTSALLLLVCITVCGPSWILAILGNLASSGQTASPGPFNRSVLFSICWLWILFLLGLNLWPHSLWPTLLAAAIGDLVCMSYCFDHTVRWSKRWPKLPAAAVLIFTTGIWFASIFALLPFAYLGSFFGKVDSLAQFIALLLCVFLVGLAGYFPGILAYRGQINKLPPLKQLTKTGIGLLFTALALVVLPAMLAPKFPWLFLETLDVYSVEPKEFMVIEEKMLPRLQSISATQGTSSATVKVFSRFSFGDVRLLCKDSYLPYDPEKASFGATDEKEARMTGRKAGNNCVAVKRDDVRELR